MIRNIIFDWSGTLVDDLPGVWQATNHVFRKAGLAELTLDQFRAEFCLPFKSFYDRYTPHVPLPQLEEWFHGHFKELPDAFAELPHAREFLLFCRQQKIRTYLLSSIHRDHYRIQSGATGFDQFLDRAYIEVLDKRARITDIMTENNLDRRETLFVGDMQHDIEAARHGGVFACAVLTGYNRLDQLRAAQPDLIVEHLGQLRSLLEHNGGFLHTLPPTGTDSDLLLPVVTVGGLIFNPTRRVLMIRTHKWSDLWGIPGGKVKWGESCEAALRREIKEETQLEIDQIKFVLAQDCIGSKEFYRQAHFVLLNYTCRSTGPYDVRLNQEAQQFNWVTLPQALQMELNAPTRLLITTVAQNPSAWIP